MIYNGVFLLEPSVLMEWWVSSGLPVSAEADVKCSHITSYFRPKGEDKSLPYGEGRGVKVVGFSHTPQIAAVVVEVDIPSKNNIKHITVWVDGVSPAKSNGLLEAGYTDIDGPLLKGIVGYFSGKEVVTSAQ